jgi:hypothetical protein
VRRAPWHGPPQLLLPLPELRQPCLRHKSRGHSVLEGPRSTAVHTTGTRRLTAGDLKDGEEAEIRAAQISVSAARRQLARIDRDLCQRFIELWRSDLAQWRDYITGDKLPRLDKHSVGQALDHLGLDYLFSPSSR